MKALQILIVFLIAFTASLNAQNADQVIQQIIEINEVQDVFVGDHFPRDTSSNYLNFLKLSKVADLKLLTELIDHESPVIATYASWALIDKHYKGLNSVYLNFRREMKRFGLIVVTFMNNMNYQIYSTAAV